ncbi:unnamed protein product [Camellia sinensis]
MGGKCPHRKVKKRSGSRDDAVYEELRKPDDEKKPLPVDEDLPGMGQYYCIHCDRYFASVAVRDEHFKTKRHRKRVKQMMGPAPHTQLDADLAAGMGMPDNGPKLMSMGQNGHKMDLRCINNAQIQCLSSAAPRTLTARAHVKHLLSATHRTLMARFRIWHQLSTDQEDFRPLSSCQVHIKRYLQDLRHLSSYWRISSPKSLIPCQVHNKKGPIIFSKKWLELHEGKVL